MAADQTIEGADVPPPYRSPDRSGGMAALVEAKDWSQTPLGPRDKWPRSLRTAVGICLGSRFPMFLWWGPDLINIYNDAYISILGRRHPDALGRSAPDLWREVWPVIGPQVEAVMERGEASWHQRAPLMVERNGYAEKAYFTWSHSAVPGDDGQVSGVLCVVIEETAAVLGERERERLVQERARADEQSRTILESITDAFFALDRAWRFTYANAQAERVLSRPPGDLLGKVLWDEYPGLYGSEFERVYRRAATEGIPGAVTAFYPDHDRWYEVHAYPAPNGGVSVYFRNVTDRMRAEKEVRASEARRSTALAIAHLGTFEVDARTSTLSLDDRAREIFGFGPGEGTRSEEVFARIDPIDRPRVIAEGQASRRNLSRLETEYRVNLPDGGVRYVASINDVIAGADGQAERMFGVWADVTERRRTEEALLEMAERFERQSRLFERIASTTLDFIYVFDLEGRFLYANRRLLEVWGRTFEDAVGKNLYELGYPDWHADMHMAELRQVIATKQPIRGEVPFTGGSGISGTYEYIFTPVLDRKGEVEVIAGTTRDVTERKQAEEERRQQAVAREELLASERAARAEAERQSRIKDEFLATLSHELRTPLNAILGWSQVLRSRRTGSPEDMQRGLETIERNARAQTRIIEDLLDMSRIVSGKIRLDVLRVALSSVIEAAVGTIRHAADAKGVRLQVVLDPNAGPVAGDPARLQQVFWNLLSNSVKHSQRGGRVQVLLERVSSHLEVSVIDDGEGISPEFLPHVFDRFRQADSTTTRRHGGLGLGLSIVKQLVELHGGTVRAKSPGVGRGATFTVMLPLTPVHQDPEPVGERRHPRAEVDANVFPDACVKLTGVRVLVVDDELDARALVKRLLEDCEAVVVTAASASEALALLPQEKPDVVVSDIGMPGEDGYSLIRKVRALGPDEGGDVPAVALTAYARSEDRTRAMLAGFQTHVAKPVEPVELVATVASLARRTGRD